MKKRLIIILYLLSWFGLSPLFANEPDRAVTQEPTAEHVQQHIKRTNSGDYLCLI